MDALHPYRAAIRPEWIDYNGHLRDAYYVVLLSEAIDDLMDQIGLDAGYRERTRCTLYTLELHMHYLKEVKESEQLEVATSILDADGKRIHAGCRFTCGSTQDAVATGDLMLLHVHQGPTPAGAPFPADVAHRLQSLVLPADASAAWGPRSRKLEIRRRPAP